MCVPGLWQRAPPGQTDRCFALCRKESQNVSFIRISAQQARDLIANEALVVDIRDHQSYAAGCIENAVHITADNVDDFIQAGDHSRPLIVCCYHGNASQGAAAYFSENGFLQTYSLDGGYEAWQEMQDGDWQ